MHQPGARLGRGLRQRGRCGGVERAGQIHFTLGLVDGGVGCSIDDDIGAQGAHGVGQSLRPTQVATRLAVAIKRGQLTQRRQAALQFPAHLTVLAEQEDFHA
jgi:hypothetical protein